MRIKIHLIDEVNCKIEGLSDEELSELQEVMKITEKGAYSRPDVQLGYSDGKVSMVDDSGVFAFFQLDQVVHELEDIGICKESKIEFVDHREPIKHPVDDKELPVVDKDYFKDYGIELWDHQIEFFHEFPRMDKGIFDASTSAGKTIIAGGVAKYYDKHYRSLTVTLNDKLIKDMGAMFDKLELDYVVLDAKKKPAKRKELISQHRHIITTRGIAMNHADDFEDIGVFIVDEAHQLGEAFEQFGRIAVGDSSIRLGLSGSLPEKKSDPLKRQMIFNMIGGEIVTEVLPGYLMDQGYAAMLDVRVVTIDDHIGKCKFMDVGSDLWDWPMEAAHYACNERVELIASFISDNCPRNTLIICSREVGIKLAKELECPFVDKDTPNELREEYYSRFDKDDDFRLVGTFGTMGTGISIDMIHYGVLIDIGANPTRMGQAIGRFMRKDHVGGNKDSAIVLDIHSNTKYGMKHRRERMKYFKQRGFAVQDKFKKLTLK